MGEKGNCPATFCFTDALHSVDLRRPKPNVHVWTFNVTRRYLDAPWLMGHVHIKFAKRYVPMSVRLRSHELQNDFGCRLFQRALQLTFVADEAEQEIAAHIKCVDSATGQNMSFHLHLVLSRPVPPKLLPPPQRVMRFPFLLFARMLSHHRRSRSPSSASASVFPCTRRAEATAFPVLGPPGRTAIPPGTCLPLGRTRRRWTPCRHSSTSRTSRTVRPWSASW